MKPNSRIPQQVENLDHQLEHSMKFSNICKMHCARNSPTVAHVTSFRI